MEVKPGYKQTEVGVIPEDWEVKPLSSLSTEIGDGIHSTPNYVKSSEFHFVNGNNLVGDRIAITESTMCVSEAEYKTLRKNLTDRTLLLSINGTIGNLAFYNGEQVVLGKSAAYMSIVKGVSRRFVSYCLKSRPTFLFFDNELTGTTIRNLSLQSLRNTPIPLPSTLPEQRAIATALSDVDGLLGGLDRLIAKKRDLKQAAMQQLLTGQTRLPGFHGEWEVKTLGNLIQEIGDGATPSTADPRNFGGGINWVVIDDIKDEITSTSTTLTARGLQSCAATLWKPGTLILSTGATIGEVGIARIPVATKQGICGLVVDAAEANALFLKYWFVQNKSALLSKAQGSTIKEVRAPNLVKFELRVPRIPEQTAIAEVLTEMDAELAALEQRREKTRNLKQAMMQELLTGRTRLV